MPESIELQALRVETEVTYGTDPTPTATNDVFVTEGIYPLLTIEEEYPNTRDALSNASLLQGVPGRPEGVHVTVEIPVELRGTGEAYSTTNLPEIDPLIRACGLARTDDFTGGAELVSYSPANSAHDSCTIYGYAAGNLYIVTGARGAFEWSLAPGVLASMRFTMRGVMRTLPATTAVVTPAEGEAAAPANVGLALTIGGWTPDHLLDATLVVGPGPVLIPSANAADGIGEFAIPHFDDMRFAVTATAEALATFNPYSDRRPTATPFPTARAIAATVGSAQYQRVDLAVTNAYLIEQPGHGEQDGFATWELSYRLRDLLIRFD